MKGVTATRQCSSVHRMQPLTLNFGTSSSSAGVILCLSLRGGIEVGRRALMHSHDIVDSTLELVLDFIERRVVADQLISSPERGDVLFSRLHSDAL